MVTVLGGSATTPIRLVISDFQVMIPVVRATLPLPTFIIPMLHVFIRTSLIRCGTNNLIEVHIHSNLFNQFDSGVGPRFRPIFNLCPSLGP